MKLNNNEYHPYFETYIGPLAKREESLTKLMEMSAQSLVELLLELPEEKEDFRYAEGKWSIKELLLHVIDTERIFQYRALRIGRNDSAEMQGFNQDDFIKYAEADNRTIQSLIDEFIAVRQASISLFGSFSDEALVRMGKASGNFISVRALGYMVSGHQMHHQKVFEERYL